MMMVFFLGFGVGVAVSIAIPAILIALAWQTTRPKDNQATEAPPKR